jgi:SPX domain protein involved in polyphosphate accumulation
MKKFIVAKNFRYERKFIVNTLESNEIEYLVKHHPAMFSEIFYERRVNNLYFDSFNLKSYRDNLAGNPQRFKIRIRWYGKILGFISNPVLEIKIKNNLLGQKLSFKLKPFILDKNFSYEILQKRIFQKSGLPSWVLELLKTSQPILLNSYKRKYFLSANKKYRITIDKDFLFFKMGIKNNNFNEKIMEKNINILELKYSRDYDIFAQNITKHFPFRLSAASKYVFGVNLLEL